MINNNHDAIYAEPLNHVDAFTFDENVVNVFSDMIGRSVPGYTLTLPLISHIAARYIQPNSRCYDLGCSLGAVLLSIRRRIEKPNVRLIGVDNSVAMVAQCRELVAADPSSVPVEIIEGDIRDVPIVNASMVVLNYTLQFVAPESRDAFIARLVDGLLPGGVLVLSEKVLFSDADQNDRMVDLHHDFKRANGYSDLEISQKRTALENVLISETIETHHARLHQAGFRSSEVWFQAYNFVSFLAIK